MRKFITFLIFSVIILSSHFTPCAAQDLYDYEHTKAFAEHLLDTRQYSLAISEYERLVFLNPGDKSLQRTLFSTYIHAENSSLGLKRAQLMYPSEKRIPAEVAPIYAFMLLKNKAFDKAKDFLTNDNTLSKDDKYLFLGTSNALNHDWKNALSYYNKVAIDQKPIVANYREITELALQQKYKSPGLATGLSILIPGAGKVYTRDWKDGLVSLLFVGTTAWQAHRGFSRSGTESVRGWIFASISTGFYIGNIFGSHKSAKIYNQRLNEHSQREIERIFYTDF